MKNASQVPAGFLIHTLSAILLGLLLGQHLQAQEERKLIRKGTKQYESGKFLESEIEYRRALDKEQNSFEGNFNLGNALFKQEKADEALSQYQKVAEGERDPSKMAKIHHNIGNVHFAKQEYEKSIQAYKTALKQNPADDETRYNLIAAQKMLKKQQDQQNKQDQKQEKQEKQQEQPKDQQEQKQDAQQQPNPSQMSKQDAERLLNAIQQDENELQEKLKKVNAAERAKIEKNW